jgi:repressor LexA
LRVLAEVLGQEENNYLPAGKTESKKKSHLAAVGTTNLSHMDQGQIHERRDPSRLPLAGTIAAGQPIDAIDSGEYLDVESNYGGSGCYALRVKGESMIEDGIYDGDFVIVKPNPSPRNGEIVVALLEDGSATLKRFYKEKSGYRLQPANKNMQPIFVESSNNLQVQGTVVGLFRKMS